jgi:hypothetical protein
MALPGVKTTILDRFYNQSRTDLPGGPLIAVIAKRTTAQTSDAPNLKAYFATGEQDIIAQFGENSHAHRAYYELTTSGASRIAIVALPSDTVFDQANGTLSSAVDPSATLFDDAIGAVESARADILLLQGRGSDASDWNDLNDPATPGDNTDDFFYADNSIAPSKSWASKLAGACALVTNNSHPMLGVIGLKGIIGLESPTPTEVSTGLGFSNLISRDNASIIGGHLISVVASECHVLGAPASWGYQNGASSYAAAVSRLDSWSATTGKPIHNIDRLRYNPTRTQLESLVNKGVAPSTIGFDRSAKWVDGITFGTEDSDYGRLTTVRIVFDAVKLVRRVSDDYIGETMSIDRQQAFSTQISSALQSMQRLGALNNSDFRILYAPSQNKASIDLALLPAFELREVVISVSVDF